MKESKQEKWRWRWACRALIESLYEPKDNKYVLGKKNDISDNKLIDEAKKETVWKQGIFDDFLIKYGISRNIPKTKRESFINICHPIFKKPIRYDKTFANVAQDRWFDAVAQLRNSGHSNLHAATLKMFWFYHPKILTMYDSYARVALQYEARQLCFDANINKDKPQDNFLENFYCYFRKNNCKILIEDAYKWCNENLNDWWEEQYDYRVVGQYPYRVVDQYLWLAGSGEETKRLEKFENKQKWEN